MSAKLPIICAIEEGGAYVAVCPEISGCFTQADTYEEAIDNLRELISDRIKEDLDDDDRQFILRPVERVYSEIEVSF